MSGPEQNLDVNMPPLVGDLRRKGRCFCVSWERILATQGAVPFLKKKRLGSLQYGNRNLGPIKYTTLGIAKAN